MYPLAVAALAGLAAAAGAPNPSVAPGCQSTYTTPFQITTVNATGMAKRQDPSQGDPNKAFGPGMLLTMTIRDGVMMSNTGDQGYIAANHQFQYDNPPQPDNIYDRGFSVCPNNTLALGGSAIWYSCNSGPHNNLYDQSQGMQCSQVFFEVMPEGGASGSSSSAAPSSAPAGGATSVADGQPQGPTSAPAVSQIGDNQPQAPTKAPVTQIGDNQPQAPTSAPAVSQIGDNQPQAPTSAAPAVSQIGDNQPQAPTSAAPAVSQIGDNQPQAPTSAAPAVSQIGDNQPQAPTSAAPAVSQIGDNQPQAPTSAAPAVSQIGDNQPQAPTSAVNAAAAGTASASPVQYTGAAAMTGFSNLALAGAGVVAAALL